MRSIQLSVLSSVVSLVVAGCNTGTGSAIESVDQKGRTLTGIYTISTKGNSWECESIKHYFEISVYKKDSSFLYHAFCQPDNFDPTGIKNTLTPRNVIGKWTYGNDSLLKLEAYNGAVVKLKVNEDLTVDAFEDNGEDLYTDLYFDSTRIYR